MNFDKRYNHELVEVFALHKFNKIDLKSFSRNQNLEKDNFVILLPPLNLTGTPHLGHVYENTLQDILVRFYHLKGKNVLFVPGLDHAGIATQKKVLDQNNVSTNEISKATFLRLTENWRKNYWPLILNNWEKLGLFLNQDYFAYTMDPDVEKIVNKIFKSLWDKNLIYRAKRIVNQDVILKTAISDLETENQNVESFMYYVKYYFVDDLKKYLLVATTRPETIFADAALLVARDDKRYQKYLGKKVINPLTTKKITIFTSDIVDSEFGTGVVKCTPAHDFNDFKANETLNLNFSSCINFEGKMINVPDIFLNLTVKEARKKVVNVLKGSGHLKEIQKYKTTVKISTRSNSIVEPLVSNQWFLKTSQIAKAYKNYCLKHPQEKIIFFPKKFQGYFDNWLNNMQDWCISRQIWWGTRIPLAFNKKLHKFEYFDDFENIGNYPNLTLKTDVLDTWFNSSLWPFICAQYQKNSDLFQQIFPSSVLVTGYDIILFWVARMILQSFAEKGVNPFPKVLIHGLVRDKYNRKMSKMLNNGIEPNILFKKYGVDAVRFYFATACKIGEDLSFNENKLKASRNFLIKIYNIANLLEQLNSMFPKYKFSLNAPLNLKNIFPKEMVTITHTFLNKCVKNINNYRLSIVGNDLYGFVFDNYANQFLEYVKFIASGKNEEQIYEYLNTAHYLFIKLLAMLSVYCPFITSYILQGLYNIKSFNEINLNYESKENSFNSFLTEKTWTLIKTIRNFKSWFNLSHNVNVQCTFSFFSKSEFYENWLIIPFLEIQEFIYKLTGFRIIFTKEDVKFTSKSVAYPLSFGQFLFDLRDLGLNNAKAHSYLNEKALFLNNEVKRSKHILNNEKFLKNADPRKIALEKDKLSKYFLQQKLIDDILKEF